MQSTLVQCSNISRLIMNGILNGAFISICSLGYILSPVCLSHNWNRSI